MATVELNPSSVTAGMTTSKLKEWRATFKKQRLSYRTNWLQTKADVVNRIAHSTTAFLEEQDELECEDGAMYDQISAAVRSRKVPRTHLGRGTKE